MSPVETITVLWRENSRKGSDSTWSGSVDAAASRAGSRSGKEAAASSVETTSLSHEADPHRFRMRHVETLSVLYERPTGRMCIGVRSFDDLGRRAATLEVTHQVLFRGVSEVLVQAPQHFVAPLVIGRTPVR